MTINEMRAIISDAYSGEKWKQRCRNMPSKQVCAIYYSLQSRDRDKKRNSEKQQKQLTIFDFI